MIDFLWAVPASLVLNVGWLALTLWRVKTDPNADALFVTITWPALWTRLALVALVLWCVAMLVRRAGKAA